MEKVAVSLKALYDSFGGQLTYGTIHKEIDGDYEYYDLQTGAGTVCMDGEECVVVDKNEFGYSLLNIDDETNAQFILTEEEYNIGVFENRP